MSPVLPGGKGGGSKILSEKGSIKHIPCPSSVPLVPWVLVAVLAKWKLSLKPAVKHPPPRDEESKSDLEKYFARLRVYIVALFSISALRSILIAVGDHSR